MTHSDRAQQNIVAAQCRDLGMQHIQREADGTVLARLRDVIYHFRWNVEAQRLDLLGRFDTAPVFVIVEE